MKYESLKESEVTTQGRREVEVGIFLLGNYKHNAVADTKYLKINNKM